MNPPPYAASRRAFLTTTVTAAAALAPALRAAERDWTGRVPTRYPDPDILSLDRRFDHYRLGNTSIRRLYHSADMLWAEGIVWNAVGRYVAWSDIPNDRQLRWIEDDGRVTVFRQPAGHSNGNTFDWEGRQIACEHGHRRVVRYEHSGAVTVLAERFGGKPFNAPNDAVVHPDGGIWFTDPGYGSMMHYEGNKAPLELKEAVYRIDPKTLQVAKVTDDIVKPNGLCFSPDYKKLYVADTGAPKNIRVWDVVDGTRLRGGREFATAKLESRQGAAPQSGGYDGLRCDTDGNIWAAAGWGGAGYDGVHVFAPDGARIGLILLPEICANLCFGGRKRNRLFLAASTSIYAVYVEARGAHLT